MRSFIADRQRGVCCLLPVIWRRSEGGGRKGGVSLLSLLLLLLPLEVQTDRRCRLYLSLL